MTPLSWFILIGAVVTLGAIVAARVGDRLGLPALLLFLLLGMALGDSGLGIRFSDATLAHDLGFIALALILAEGGLTTHWEDVRPVLGLGLLLATLGVLVTIGLVGLFSYYVLHLPRSVAFLLGAVVAPTDSAAVFSVLRGVRIPTRLRAALEAESGLNDAPTVLLVAAGTAFAMGQPPRGGVAGLLGMVLLELVGGTLLGAAVGFLATFVMRRIALPATGLYPLAALAWLVAGYGVAPLLHVSGFAAVYVAGVIVGNGRLPHRHAIRSFAEGVGWISQIGLFVMLGLLASPTRLTWGGAAIGIAVGLFLTLVARPVAVFACASWFKMPWRQQAFLSWAGLRGAVPIILATVPLAAGMGHATELFDVVLIFVIVFTALQAPTLEPLARRLRLINPHAPSDADIEVAPLESRRADLLHITVPPGSQLAGVRVMELRLPRNAVVSLVMRGDETFTPDGHTALQVGDELLVVTPTDARRQVESRFIEIGRGGRLAHWRGVRPDPQ